MGAETRDQTAAVSHTSSGQTVPDRGDGGTQQLLFLLLVSVLFSLTKKILIFFIKKNLTKYPHTNRTYFMDTSHSALPGWIFAAEY